MCERVRADLKLHQCGIRSFTTLLVPKRQDIIAGPKPTPFPPSIRIVNTCINAARIKPERIGDAQMHKFLTFLLEGKYFVRLAAWEQRRFLAKT
jgi:hypothetical protein